MILLCRVDQKILLSFPILQGDAENGPIAVAENPIVLEAPDGPVQFRILPGKSGVSRKIPYLQGIFLCPVLIVDVNIPMHILKRHSPGNIISLIQGADRVKQIAVRTVRAALRGRGLHGRLRQLRMPQRITGVEDRK